MSDIGLGKLITDDKAGRDAVHIAVVPTTATESLYPGDECNALGGNPTADYPAVGVVDPYLTECVWAGQRFWLFLFPNTITDLRHVWTHPAFPEEPIPNPIAAYFPTGGSQPFMLPPETEAVLNDPTVPPLPEGVHDRIMDEVTRHLELPQPEKDGSDGFHPLTGDKIWEGGELPEEGDEVADKPPPGTDRVQ